MFEEPCPIFGPDFNETERPWRFRGVEDIEEQALGLVNDGGPDWPEGREEFVDVARVDFDCCMESQLAGLEGLGVGHCEWLSKGRGLAELESNNLERRLIERDN